jgi:hypothetical protein
LQEFTMCPVSARKKLSEMNVLEYGYCDPAARYNASPLPVKYLDGDILKYLSDTETFLEDSTVRPSPTETATMQVDRIPEGFVIWWPVGDPIGIRMDHADPILYVVGHNQP